MKQMRRLSWKRKEWRLGRLGVLICLLLAACGPVTGPAPEEATPEPPAPGESGANARATRTPIPTPTPPRSAIPVQASDLEGVEVTLWHAWSGVESGTVSGLVAQFNRENPWGVVARAQAYPGYDSLDEAVSAALEAGDAPNVATAYLYQALGWEQGAAELVELDGYVDDPVWGLSADEQGDFFAAFWEHDRAREPGLVGRAGVPAQRSAQVLYYNTTWAQELGFDRAPTTPAQLKEQACAAAQANKGDDDRDNDGSGGVILSTHYSAVLGWLHAFGVQVSQEDNSGYKLQQPAMEQAFRFLRNLYDEGCAWLPDELGGQDPHQAFASRGGLFAVGSVAAIPTQEGVFADLESKDRWAVIAYPGQGGRQAIEVYGPSFFLLKSSPKEQLATWLLVRWLVSPESQASLAQANAWFPVRRAALEAMDRLPATYPQWAAAAGLLEDAYSEPSYRSWVTVRWALSDAATQLFRYYFTIDQVPQLVRLLDETAAEYHP